MYSENLKRRDHVADLDVDGMILKWILEIYKGHLKSSWTGGSVPLLCCYASLCITAAHYRQSTNFLNGPRSCSAILKRVLLKDCNSNSNDG
jgi:hypothetical protein